MHEMSEDKISKSLRNCLTTLSNLEVSLSSEKGPPPSPEDLEKDLTKFIKDLKELHSTGNEAYKAIPLDLLEFLESNPTIVDPTNYFEVRLKKCDNTAQKFDERLTYIQGVEKAVTEALSNK